MKKLVEDPKHEGAAWIVTACLAVAGAIFVIAMLTGCKPPRLCQAVHDEIKTGLGRLQHFQ